MTIQSDMEEVRFTFSKFIEGICDYHNEDEEFCDNLRKDSAKFQSFLKSKLEAQEREHRAEIDCWHNAFGSTQLSHAIANVESDKEQQEKRHKEELVKELEKFTMVKYERWDKLDDDLHERIKELKGELKQ